MKKFLASIVIATFLALGLFVQNSALAPKNVKACTSNWIPVAVSPVVNVSVYEYGFNRYMNVQFTSVIYHDECTAQVYAMSQMGTSDFTNFNNASVQWSAGWGNNYGFGNGYANCANTNYCGVRSPNSSVNGLTFFEVTNYNTGGAPGSWASNNSDWSPQTAGYPASKACVSWGPTGGC